MFGAHRATHEKPKPHGANTLPRSKSCWRWKGAESACRTEGGEEKSRNRANKLMKMEIVPYDQNLAEASLGSVLCSPHAPPPRLDLGQVVGKIRKFRRANYCKGKLSRMINRL